MRSDDKIGIVGPLSNAAAYQSVPFTKDESRTWVTNTIPAGLSPAHVDSLVEEVSHREFPRGVDLILDIDTSSRADSLTQRAKC